MPADPATGFDDGFGTIRRHEDDAPRRHLQREQVVRRAIAAHLGHQLPFGDHHTGPRRQVGGEIARASGQQVQNLVHGDNCVTCER